jgi:uncharacterized protein (TIGR02246 family)
MMETTSDRLPASAEAASDDEQTVRALYEQVLTRWNERNASQMAALFEHDGSVVGFDGSPINGRNAIASAMGDIFKDHQTARYVGIVREVRFLNREAALLRAVAGMVPPGQTDLNPGVNAIQTLVAAKRDSRWLIAMYQNTPAAFHGRPDVARALTDELRQKLSEC